MSILATMAVSEKVVWNGSKRPANIKELHQMVKDTRNGCKEDKLNVDINTSKGCKSPK